MGLSKRQMEVRAAQRAKKPRPFDPESTTYSIGQLRRRTADLDTLFETDEEVLALAEELRKRHEFLMETNERYKELYERVPDRSGYNSGAPIRSFSVAPMVFQWKRLQQRHFDREARSRNIDEWRKRSGWWGRKGRIAALNELNARSEEQSVQLIRGTAADSE